MGVWKGLGQDLGESSSSAVVVNPSVAGRDAQCGGCLDQGQTVDRDQLHDGALTFGERLATKRCTASTCSR